MSKSIEEIAAEIVIALINKTKETSPVTFNSNATSAANAFKVVHQAVKAAYNGK